MNYVCTDVRFLFFDGLSRYTVAYCYGLSKWFIFNDTETSNAIFQKEDKRTRSTISFDKAKDILYEFLLIN